jgi:hypothetical protein
MASGHPNLQVPSNESSDHVDDNYPDNNDDPANASFSESKTPYNDLPQYANTMGKQSASLPSVEFQICDICVDTFCDNMFPPCCDNVGNTDLETIPDLNLCDENVTWFQRLQFCIFFEFGKVSKLFSWFCVPYDRVFGWSKVSDAVVDSFKLCGNPDLFNTGCVASCIPYFALCYLIYTPLWLPCYACFALSQSFRKVRSAIKSRTGRFLANGSYMLSSWIGMSFRKLANALCPGRTCFGFRKGCGPECSQTHRGGRYYNNFGLKSDGYEEYCFVCDQSWDLHTGYYFFVMDLEFVKIVRDSH